MVKVRALHPVKTPVTLAEIKADPDFADLPLVRQSRLSVSPVPDAAWTKICAMARVAPCAETPGTRAGILLRRCGFGSGFSPAPPPSEIGRASCRERVCQYV